MWLDKELTTKQLLTIAIGFMAITQISGCENSVKSADGSTYHVITGDSGQGYLFSERALPTRCLNGVWYYSAEYVHNTYFAPVFTKNGTVALCDGTQKQYVPKEEVEI